MHSVDPKADNRMMPRVAHVFGVLLAVVALMHDPSARSQSTAAAQSPAQTGTQSAEDPAEDPQASLSPLTLRYGDVSTLGDGQAKTYVQSRADGRPYALGVELSEKVLTNLPTEEADGRNCWDLNEDGELGPGECTGGHERTLYFPGNSNTPFKWMLLSWTHGHPPAGIYSVPHFDVNFFIMDELARNFIRPGPCATVVNCDDRNQALLPVPARYSHPDYSDVGAVVGREGNHLIDLTAPEFATPDPDGFKQAMLYGNYAGHITIWEPMIALKFLRTQPNECTAIKVPQGYEAAGYYPTRYCVRYKPRQKVYRISLEGFEYRTAS